MNPCMNPWWLVFSGVVLAHLVWLAIFLLICAWENRGGITYRKRPSDP